MKQLYLNLEPGSALIEDCKAGEQSIPLNLAEPEAKVVHSLLAMDSYLLSRAMAALVLAGIQIRQRDRRTQPAS